MSSSVKILAGVPHRDDAPSISTVDARDLDIAEFARSYIERMRPCLVRGAARHWPAYERWRSLDYISDKIGNPDVTMATRPLREPLDHPANQAALRTLPFAEFAAEIQSGVRGHRVLHAYRLGGSKSPLAALGDDVLGFPFVGDVAQPRAYPPKRAFLFLDSYTDWHYHPTDETLMTQVKGRKEVLLLPPDRASFELLTSIAGERGSVWDVDAQQFPAWSQLRPYRVVVEPGDALYIPTYWWHAVESIESDFGWTVAWCWRTPLHLFDPRLAGVRAMMLEAIRTKRVRFAILAAVCSVLSVRRFGRTPFSV